MKLFSFCLSLALGLFFNLVFSGVARAQVAGDRVLARWAPDGLFYPAKVQLVDRLGLHVAYDDGDLAVVQKADIRRVDWRVGTSLECNWHNKGSYFAGKISAMRGEVIDVRYADGDAEQMTISRCRSR